MGGGSGGGRGRGIARPGTGQIRTPQQGIEARTAEGDDSRQSQCQPHQGLLAQGPPVRHHLDAFGQRPAFGFQPEGGDILGWCRPGLGLTIQIGQLCLQNLRRCHAPVQHATGPDQRYRQSDHGQGDHHGQDNPEDHGASPVFRMSASVRCSSAVRGVGSAALARPRRRR